STENGSENANDEAFVEKSSVKGGNKTSGSGKATSNTKGQAEMLFPDKPHPVVEALENLSPDELSPRQALDLIYTLKRLSQS
ncbi:MAG: hypothetical protein VXW99_11330, partial [Pseudomonadota bacterium]|nr:hypothetical protein [Pseudomonadota bacterium]